MEIKGIIIDDESKARIGLKAQLDRIFPEISIVNESSSVSEAYDNINQHQPDIIFLDVEMQDGTGFDLLNRYDTLNFHVIFTTAYDQYAVRAFRFSAIDYLLKPIDSDDLQKVVKRILKNKTQNNLGTELKFALEKILISQNKNLNKVALTLNGKIVFVKLDDIIYCKSDGSYTTIHLINKEKILISKKIKDVEVLCNSTHFLRVHQSYVVNITFVKEYIKSDGYYLVLEDKTTIPVSKANRSFLQQNIESL